MKLSISFARAAFVFTGSAVLLFMVAYILVCSGYKDDTILQNAALTFKGFRAANATNYLDLQPSYKTDFPKDYFWKLDNESKVHSQMLHFLDVLNPVHALPSVLHADLSNAVIVSAIDKSHYEDLLFMCATMSAYKKFGSKLKRRLVVYLLGVIGKSDLKKLTAKCHFIEIRQFPYDLFPGYFRNLFEYRFKPAVVALMLKENYVVYWLDSSARFDTADNATSIEDYFEMLKEKNIPFAMPKTARHSLLAATHPMMYTYLPIEEKSKKVDVGLAGMMFFIGTKEVKTTILLRFLQCAFVPQCMAPLGHRRICHFKDRFNKYAGCHRYDLSAVNIIANLFTNNRTDRYIVPFRAVTVRRHVP